MENNRFLKIVIMVLLVINIGTISFIWFQHSPLNHGPRPPQIGEYLAHELNFTDEQQKQFEDLRSQHRDKIDPIRNSSKALHDSLFALLKSPQDSLKINETIEAIATTQIKIEQATFEHLIKIRNICTPEQQHKFDSVINDAMRMMAPHPGR